MKEKKNPGLVFQTFTENSKKWKNETKKVCGITQLGQLQQLDELISPHTGLSSFNLSPEDVLPINWKLLRC